MDRGTSRLRVSIAAAFLSFVALPIAAPAQTPAASPAQKPDRLLLYGDNYTFSVKEPADWHGDSGDLAKHYQVNIVFAPTIPSDPDQDITIRVRANHKVDENTIEDLQYDMSQYKHDYPKAHFTPLTVAHPDYKTFAELVDVPGRFYEYVAYVNPGPQSKFTLSVAMSSRGKAATASEVQAYEEVLKSLVWLANQGLPTSSPQ